MNAPFPTHDKLLDRKQLTAAVLRKHVEIYARAAADLTFSADDREYFEERLEETRDALAREEAEEARKAEFLDEPEGPFFSGKRWL